MCTGERTRAAESARFWSYAWTPEGCRAADGKNLEIFGADVTGQCLQRGLVDEILVHIVPVLLGGGTPFSSPGLARIGLEPISTTRSGSVTTLRFRVRNSIGPTFS